MEEINYVSIIIVYRKFYSSMKFSTNNATAIVKTLNISVDIKNFKQEYTLTLMTLDLMPFYSNAIIGQDNKYAE